MDLLKRLLAVDTPPREIKQVRIEPPAQVAAECGGNVRIESPESIAERIEAAKRGMGSQWVLHPQYVHKKT